MACDLAALQESERAPPKFRFVRCAGRSEVGSQKVCHPAVGYSTSIPAPRGLLRQSASQPPPPRYFCILVHRLGLILSSDGASEEWRMPSTEPRAEREGA